MPETNIVKLLEAGRRDEAARLLQTPITFVAATGPRSTEAAIQAATQLFGGNVTFTTAWMNRKHLFLPGSPLEVAESSDEGLQDVLDLIGRAAWGVYS